MTVQVKPIIELQCGTAGYGGNGIVVQFNANLKLMGSLLYVDLCTPTVRLEVKKSRASDCISGDVMKSIFLTVISWLI